MASSFLIGKEMAAQTISKTSSSIISKLGNLYGTNYESIFTELDIKFKIDIVNSYISKIDTNSLRLTCDAVSKCIEYIKDILIEIEGDMNKLQKLLDQNYNKWFGNSYSNNSSEIINDIRIKVHILDQRFDILLKLLG